jgi:flagellar biosynthesis/type III secretory pathway M-ring protein FliF/YscJ
MQFLQSLFFLLSLLLTSEASPILSARKTKATKSKKKSKISRGVIAAIIVVIIVIVVIAAIVFLIMKRRKAKRGNAIEPKVEQHALQGEPQQTYPPPGQQTYAPPGTAPPAQGGGAYGQNPQY